MTVDEVSAEVTYALRGAVLRPNGGEITWAGDEDPATFHLAARTADGARRRRRPLLPRALPVAAAAPRAPWQLRGMATDAAVRGSGAGRRPGRGRAGRAWPPAAGTSSGATPASTAAGFYERMGFTVVTERVRQAGHRPARRHGDRGQTGGWSPLELIPGIAPARKASTNRRWSSWVCRA